MFAVPSTCCVLSSFVSFTTSADGDPHFVVEFPLSKLTVCFNINGEPGHILRLVSDHKHSGEDAGEHLLQDSYSAHRVICPLWGLFAQV